MKFVCPLKSSIENTITVNACIWKQLEQVVRHLPCLAQIAEIETSEVAGTCPTVTIRLVALSGERFLLGTLYRLSRVVEPGQTLDREFWTRFVADNLSWAKRSPERYRALELLCRAVFASESIEEADIAPPRVSTRAVNDEAPSRRPLGHSIRATAA